MIITQCKDGYWRIDLRAGKTSKKELSQYIEYLDLISVPYSIGWRFRNFDYDILSKANPNYIGWWLNKEQLIAAEEFIKINNNDNNIRCKGTGSSNSSISE